MLFDDLKNLLEQNIPNSKIDIQGDGCALTLNIINDELVNLSALKRQQKIYQIINPLISNGTLHAVNMRFFSHQTWNQQ